MEWYRDINDVKATLLSKARQAREQAERLRTLLAKHDQRGTLLPGEKQRVAREITLGGGAKYIRSQQDKLFASARAYNEAADMIDLINPEMARAFDERREAAERNDGSDLAILVEALADAQELADAGSLTAAREVANIKLQIEAENLKLATQS